MSTNLRLRPEAEDAVRLEARRTGRSQQEVIREAIDRYLGLSPAPQAGGELAALVATGTVRPPRAAYRTAGKRLTLPPGTSSTDLLDRDNRF